MAAANFVGRDEVFLVIGAGTSQFKLIAHPSSDGDGSVELNAILLQALALATELPSSWPSAASKDLLSRIEAIQHLHPFKAFNKETTGVISAITMCA